jgi:hypothetical protein
MIVRSADLVVHEGASLKKMLNEIETLIANGYTLNSSSTYFISDDNVKVRLSV